MEHIFRNGLMTRDIHPVDAQQTLLYIHGLGESSLCFQEMMELIADPSLRQLAPDLPGYGRSPWPEHPLSLEACADYLHGWMEAEELKPVVWIGHSMGGVLGQIFCEKYPHRITGFLNVEGNISIEDCAFSGQVVTHDGPDFNTIGFPGIQRRIYEKGLTSPAFAGYYASMRFADPRQFRQNSYDLVSQSKSQTLAQRMASLNMPVHYIAGHPGGASDRSIELIVQAGIPYSILSPSTHWPFIDQPSAFRDALRVFLEKTTPIY